MVGFVLRGLVEVVFFILDRIAVLSNSVPRRLFRVLCTFVRKWALSVQALFQLLITRNLCAARRHGEMSEWFINR